MADTTEDVTVRIAIVPETEAERWKAKFKASDAQIATYQKQAAAAEAREGEMRIELEDLKAKWAKLVGSLQSVASEA